MIKNVCRQSFKIGFFLLLSFLVRSFASEPRVFGNENSDLRAKSTLKKAIENPEFLLKNWVELPTSPAAKTKKIQHLQLREAILLALRYNPNIQNADLDRIIQVYQLRLAHNEFELQYALTGVGSVEKSHFSNVGSINNSNFIATPELQQKTLLGTQLKLNLENNVSPYNNYSPVLNLSLTQPLLRGFGKAVNEVHLLDAMDRDILNKAQLKQLVIDEVSRVINTYRALILSGNNLKNQRIQLEEAKKSFAINAKKIAAGQLEPSGNVQQAYQIESLNLLVEQAQNDFETTTQNLLQTIGLDPALHLAVPSDITITKIEVPDLKQSIDLSFSSNTRFLQQKLRLRADERALKLAKNAQLWKLDLSARLQSGQVLDPVNNGGNGFQGIYNGQNISQSAQVTLTIPLHDLKRREELINAKIVLEKDRLNFIALKRELITVVTNAINTIKSLAKRYELANKQVKLAMQAYNLEKKKQQAGIASSLDVNNTQNQLIQAQAGLISAKIMYLNQLTALGQILGTTLQDWKINLRYGE